MRKSKLSLLLALSLTMIPQSINTFAETKIYVPENGTIPEKNGEGDTSKGTIKELPEEYKHLFKNIDVNKIRYVEDYVSYEYDPIFDLETNLQSKNKIHHRVEAILRNYITELNNENRRKDYYSEKGDYILGIEVIKTGDKVSYAHLRTKYTDKPFLDFHYKDFDIIEAGDLAFNGVINFINSQSDNKDIVSLLEKMKEDLKNNEDFIIVTDIGPALIAVGVEDSYLNRWYIDKKAEGITIDKVDMTEEFNPSYIFGDYFIKEGKGDPEYLNFNTPENYENKFPYIPEEEFQHLKDKAYNFGSIEFFKLEPAKDFNIDEVPFYTLELSGTRQKGVENQGKSFVMIRNAILYNDKAIYPTYEIGPYFVVSEGILEATTTRDNRKLRIYIFEDKILIDGEKEFGIYERYKKEDTNIKTNSKTNSETNTEINNDTNNDTKEKDADVDKTSMYKKFTYLETSDIDLLIRRAEQIKSKLFYTLEPKQENTEVEGQIFKLKEGNGQTDTRDEYLKLEDNTFYTGSSKEELHIIGDYVQKSEGLLLVTKNNGRKENIFIFKDAVLVISQAKYHIYELVK